MLWLGVSTWRLGVLFNKGVGGNPYNLNLYEGWTRCTPRQGPIPKDCPILNPCTQHTINPVAGNGYQGRS